MAKPIVYRPRADGDIDEIFAWLKRQSPKAARQFLDAVEAAFALLGEQPGIGSTRHASLMPELPQPLRFHPLKDFPRILLYYIERPDAVEVLRIWDAARGLDALLNDE